MSSSNIVKLTGSLLAGPAKASCSTFPSGIVNATIELRPPNKIATVFVSHVRNVASPSAFVILDGVGSGETVSQGTLFYFRTQNEIRLRLTFDDGSGGDVVSEVPVDGLYIGEIPASKYLKLVEAQGSGVVEYFVSGNL